MRDELKTLARTGTRARETKLEALKELPPFPGPRTLEAEAARGRRPLPLPTQMPVVQVDINMHVFTNRKGKLIHKLLRHWKILM